MTRRPIDPALYERLSRRVGRVHLNQRLGIETGYESKTFGQGRTFFHIENLDSLDRVIRLALRLTLLHGRARRNARRIVVVENELPIARLPAEFDGFTLLHITDLHLDMAPDMPAVLIDAVAGLQYDICVLTGDYRAETYGDHSGAVAGLQTVRPALHDPVYAVLGNHDPIRLVLDIEELGIRALLNESVKIERGAGVLHIAGIDDPHYFRADNIEKAAADIPADEASILLAHSPEVYKNAAHAEFDAMLSGHTHGGQICLPGGTPVMINARIPRYMCSGAWEYQGLRGYTSRGSGACVVDMRLNCPPEVVLHRLRRG